MDDLRTKLSQLDAKRQAYVLARSKSSSKAEAYRESGVSKTTVAGWADKDEIEELASALRVDRVLMADQKLNDAVEEAVDALLGLMRDAKSEMVKLMSAKEVMERVMGQTTAKVDLTSKGKKLSSTVESMTGLFQTLGKLEQNIRNDDDE